MNTILLTGGGTAGHITPLVAVANELKNYDRIVYSGSGKAIENDVIKECGAIIKNTNPPKLTRGFCPKNLLIPVKLTKAVSEAKKIINEYRPAVIFSKGGYCALPVCLAALQLKIPVVCHESDRTLGLANALIAKKCDKIFCTFSETAQKYKNGIFSGPPLNEKKLKKSGKTADANESDALSLFCKKATKPLLLVTGGSQGSAALNLAVSENLNALTRDYCVIHQCGKGKIPTDKPVNGYFACEFLNMQNALEFCDVVLSRGGSNTLFEALAAKKAVLCCPLEKSSRGDQLKNAGYFEDKKALFIIRERDLKNELVSQLHATYKSRERLIKNAADLNIRGGAKLIAKTLDAYAPKKI